MNYALLAVAIEASKIAPFFFGRGRGFYLRSVAPSSPKPSPAPLHVRCGDVALLFEQSVAGLESNLAFIGVASLN